MTNRKSSVKFFFSIVTVIYSSWVLGSLLGAVLSDFPPAVLSASFAIAFHAMFLAMMAPSLKGN